VKAARARVTQIVGPDITNPDDPMVETLVGTAAQAGLTHYTLGTLTYQAGTPILAQLDALKPRIEKFVRLNEKHRMKLMFDTRPTKNAIGAVVWDLLYVMKEFDPKLVGLHWDTGLMALHGDGMWETLMRTAGPYVAGIGWRDREWQQDIGLKGEGGPYQPPPPRAGGAGAAGGRGGGGGAAAGRAGGEGAAAGRAGGAGAAGGEGARGAGGRGAAAGGEDGGRAAGGRAGGGAAGGRGRGSGEMPKTPLGGLVGRGNGWSAPMVAMGTGIVDITKVAAILHEIGFDGPSELQSEYATLGGAQSGADRIQLPRQFVIGLLKRDVITIRKAFEMANTGLAI
jgi:sugar phosphate isomerase/epimerase